MQARLPGRLTVVKHNFACICVHWCGRGISECKSPCSAPRCNPDGVLKRFRENL
jgi:hypothetical protein